MYILAYALLLVGATAATALPSKPKPIVSPERWFSTINLAEAAGTKSTMTTFDVSIDDEGRAVGCEIVIRSGAEAIDKRLCLAVVAKARFWPARDVAGNRVPAVIRERLVWKPMGPGQSGWFQAPDYVIEVPTLPRRAKKFASLAVAYRANGEIEACHVIKSSDDVSLDEQACSYAVTNHATYPVVCIACDRTPVLRFLNFGFVYAATGSVQAR